MVHKTKICKSQSPRYGGFQRLAMCPSPPEADVPPVAVLKGDLSASAAISRVTETDRNPLLSGEASSIVGSLRKPLFIWSGNPKETSRCWHQVSCWRPWKTSFIHPLHHSFIHSINHLFIHQLCIFEQLSHNRLSGHV
jgi:hypothetical protein